MTGLPPRDTNAPQLWGIWTAKSIHHGYITHNIGAVGLVLACVPKETRLVQWDCENTGLTAHPFRRCLPHSDKFHKSLL